MKVYILLEIVEGTDGIRDTYVKAVSTEKDKVIGALEKAIAEDEYGYIKRNGVCREHIEAGFFETNFEDGFVKYEMVEREVL